MTINPTSAAIPTQAVSKVAAPQQADQAAPAETLRPRAADRLELSGVSHMLELAKSSDVRMEKVQMIRDQIEAGTYDLDAKADAVAERVLDDLGM
jgi:flagellar biosynthesis anti-sigma factor FlgM